MGWFLVVVGIFMIIFDNVLMADKLLVNQIAKILTTSRTLCLALAVAIESESTAQS